MGIEMTQVNYAKPQGAYIAFAVDDISNKEKAS